MTLSQLVFFVLLENNNMGYGGNLILTGVIAEIKKKTGKSVFLCYGPRVTDLMLGKFYDRSRSLVDDDVYQKNPNIIFNKRLEKSRFLTIFDNFFHKVIYKIRLSFLYERLIHNIVNFLINSPSIYYLHVDFFMNTYVQKKTSRKFLWKNELTATSAILRNYHLKSDFQYAEMFFDERELKGFDEKFNKLNITNFILLEPDSKADWFGELRKWPFDNWQNLVNQLKANYPNLVIVQCGLKSSSLLSDVIDLRGYTSNFREACLLISKCKIFICTDGGLMHAARAMNAKTIVIWGGLNKAEFLGYPDKHFIVNRVVSCSPCGNLGWCDFDIKCMKGVTVDDVLHTFNRIYV